MSKTVKEIKLICCLLIAAGVFSGFVLIVAHLKLSTLQENASNEQAFQRSLKVRKALLYGLLPSETFTLLSGGMGILWLMRRVGATSETGR
jgi:hypothetical protein